MRMTLQGNSTRNVSCVSIPVTVIDLICRGQKQPLPELLQGPSENHKTRAFSQEFSSTSGSIRIYIHPSLNP